MSDGANQGAVAQDSGGAGGQEAQATEQSQEGIASESGGSTEGLTEAQAQEAKERLEAKILGKKQEVTRDELEQKLKQYQKYGTAERYLEDAARVRKELKAAADTLRQDPLSFMQQVMGSDQFQQTIDRIVQQRIDYELMPKDKRKEYELSEREKRIREYEERQNQTVAERQHAAEVERLKAQYQQEFPVHLQQAGLPVSQLTMQMFARKARDLQHAGKRWTSEQVAGLVKQEYSQMLSEAKKGMLTKLSSSPDEAFISEIEQEFGKEIADKWARARASQIARMKPSKQQVQEEQSYKQPQETVAKYIRSEDLRDMIRRGKV